MKTLETNTDLSMAQIAMLLGTDILNKNPKEEKSKARCAPVAFGDGHPILVLEHEQSNADVYELINSISPDSFVNYYAVLTAGWAAPNDGNDMLPPSLHPERKRVELLVVTSRDGRVASALSMEGNDELTIDEGNATGALADAVMGIFG
jgi:hypothetical protein